MNNKIAQLLQSNSPENRRQGIKLLAQSNDPQDLDIIFEVFNREKDSETKALAHRIGKLMQEKFAENVGEMEQVNILLKQAENALEKADFLKAQALISHAFQLNPDLQYDNSVCELAADIFITSPAQASVLALSIGNIDKLTHKQSRVADIIYAIIDISLMGSLAALMVFVGMLILSQTLGRQVAEHMVKTNLAPDGFFGADYGWLAGIDLVSAGRIGGMAFGICVVWVILFSIVIHIMATQLPMIAGNGFWSDLIRQLRTPLFAQTLAVGIVSIITFYWFTSAELNYYIHGDSLDVGKIGSVKENLQSIIIIVSLLFSYWQADAIGENYKIGIDGGCLTLILSIVIIVGCGLFVISTL